MQGFWVKCDSSSQMNPALNTLAYATKTRAIKRNAKSQFFFQKARCRSRGLLMVAGVADIVVD